MSSKPQVVFDVLALGNLTPNGRPGYYSWEAQGVESDAFAEMIDNLIGIAVARSADIARIYTYACGKPMGGYTTITATVEFYDSAKSALVSELGNQTIPPQVLDIDVPSQRDLYVRNASQGIIASIMARSDKGVSQEGLPRLAEVACILANSMADTLFPAKKD
tara:strand:- start:2734 stop:3222 length:489 start_codon:yes stop_codon:yes gene_type:complete